MGCPGDFASDLRDRKPAAFGTNAVPDRTEAGRTVITRGAGDNARVRGDGCFREMQGMRR